MQSPRPDFVMVGSHLPNGKVCLFASKSLTEAELRTESEEFDSLDHRYNTTTFEPRYRYFVTAEMRDWVQVVADDYAEAFRILFERWTPTGGQPQLENRLELL